MSSLDSGGAYINKKRFPLLYFSRVEEMLCILLHRPKSQEIVQGKSPAVTSFELNLYGYVRSVKLIFGYCSMVNDLPCSLMTGLPDLNVAYEAHSVNYLLLL